MKLIPLSQYINNLLISDVSLLSESSLIIHERKILRSIVRYNDFLQQELTLGMFIPCDEEGKPMEEPREDNFNTGDLETDYNSYANYFNEYQEAKSKVLFKGVEIQKDKKGIDFYNGIRVHNNVKNISDMWSIVFVNGLPRNLKIKTIEDLVNRVLRLELTEYAIEKLK
ncbi:hypothetical protein [Spongiimicrobium salis]|uniref:hypothetical protein n=1 Tax=Spongiimicrobium salis TaxID=1667022 RepID=UPI00374DACEA